MVYDIVQILLLYFSYYMQVRVKPEDQTNLVQNICLEVLVLQAQWMRNLVQLH